jgi:hypothetical protein
LLWISKLLPAGDIANTNEGLQLEWFYNSFHKEDTIESVKEYFSAIYYMQAINGNLDCKRNALACALEQHIVHHELCEWYAQKIELYADRHKTMHSHNSRYHKENCGNFKHNYNKTSKNHKKFKPCHVHGEHFKHSYNDCQPKES